MSKKPTTADAQPAGVAAMSGYVGPFNLLVPNGVLQNSSDVFSILDPDSGGKDTFGVALSADGSAPATYWGTRTKLEANTYNALANMTVTQFKAYVDQVAAQRGRNPIGSVTAFKNALVIDDSDDFWAFVASKGLQAVSG